MDDDNMYGTLEDVQDVTAIPETRDTIRARKTEKTTKISSAY